MSTEDSQEAPDTALAEIRDDVKVIREILEPLAELLPSFLPALRAKARLANSLRRVSGGAA